ncbi:class I tRNA ligase family protein, partial [Flavobacterium sp.]|uniref:class I tRNA ligase family protein n=1 Tax=Flavobacterium sp. TaxID=239 RepID=UPI0025F7BA10
VGEGIFIEVFTTRPDTIFGVTFMTLAPEHELVSQITTPQQKVAVDAYVEATAKRSERERMADVKTISGVFTGAFAEHPFTKEPIPVWIGDYVLAGYGTGAVMAVPCGDERDYAFANFFKGQLGMPEIKNIFRLISPPLEGLGEEKAFGSKEGFELVNSDFLNGLGYNDGTKKIIEELEKIHQGKGKTNYRLRDAVFSRQRYWGEPFPVYYVNGLPQMIDAKHLPIVLPEVANYLPTEDGQPPLGNATNWAWDSVNNKVVSNELISPPSERSGEETVFPLELNTMPGWAGSSWYWMRYMDAHNENEFASQKAIKYWENVDLYIGGSEHATGHLLYSRFWNKFLKDKGFAPTEEPFKKLINQGMILGMSAFGYGFGPGLSFENPNDVPKAAQAGIINKKYVIPKESYEKGLNGEFDVITQKIVDDIISGYKSHGINVRYVGEEFSGTFTPFRISLNYLKGTSDFLDIEAIKKDPLFSFIKDAEFVLDKNGEYVTNREVEKMSKSKYNVVNPDDICNDYGADTLRLYEMFLGPLEQAKPWNTAGITGVSGFLKKLWRLYFEAPSNSPEGGEQNTFCVADEVPTAEMYKSLHKTIKKVTEDIENFSFNTSVSQFMICVNELAQLKCNHRKILEPLAIVISPYAPHIAEELWSQLGHEGSISTVTFPLVNEKYLVESEKEYPVSFNGKMRFTIKLPLDLTVSEIQEIVMADERTLKQLEGRTPNKVIIVPGKVINLVG